MKRLALIVLAAFAIGLTADAQQTQPAAPAQAPAGSSVAPIGKGNVAPITAASPAPTSAATQTSPLPKLVESMEVRIINVDVVVTDRKGKPITGLTKDDFQLFENGTEKPISNFYEVTSPATPAKTAPSAAAPGVATAPTVSEPIPDNQRRRIIFYIDNLSLAPFNRNRVFKQMKQFIDEVMRPGDEGMIATFNRSMKIRMQFVRDPVALKQTLDVIAGESAMGLSNKSEFKTAEEQMDQAQSYDEALSTARTYAESTQHDLRQSVESINGLMSTLAGVEGKKILVLTSEGFPMQPGREAFQYLDDISREKGWTYGSTLMEGMGFDSHDQIQSVARTANANGITLYTIHAGGLAAGNETSAENSKPTSFAVSQAAISNSTESMQTMAEETGGLASLQTNNFAAAFKRIKEDLDSYYSLGYRGGTERVDRQRSLEVRVKNHRNYVVRSRRSFVEKSTYAEMSDRVIANLLYTSKQNDLHIMVKSDRPRPTEEGYFRVPVDVQIPMDSLTFLPLGDTEYAGGFDVYCVVANKEGDMSDVARQSHQIRLTRAEKPKAAGKFYTYSLDLLMEPGLNRISIGVIDSVSNATGFARDQVLAKDLR